MPTTDEQVENKRKDVEGLRERIASTVADIARKQREMDNDNVMTGLVAEEERLEAELAEHQKVLESLDNTSTPADTAALPAVPTQVPASSAKAADRAVDSSTNGKG